MTEHFNFNITQKGITLAPAEALSFRQYLQRSNYENLQDLKRKLPKNDMNLKSSRQKIVTIGYGFIQCILIVSCTQYHYTIYIAQSRFYFSLPS